MYIFDEWEFPLSDVLFISHVTRYSPLKIQAIHNIRVKLVRDVTGRTSFMRLHPEELPTFHKMYTQRVTMEFPPVWLDERDFGDIKAMINIQNEYALHLLLKYCATR